MNSNLKKATIGLCLLFTIASFGTLLAFAQNAADPNKQSINKLIWEIARANRSNAPFVILTPEDLAGLPKDQFGSLVTGDPCDSAAPISYGQTVSGQLTSGDCHLPDNSYADFYLFTGSQGDQVTINMSSSQFDTYLGLANEAGISRSKTTTAAAERIRESSRRFRRADFTRYSPTRLFRIRSEITL